MTTHGNRYSMCHFVRLVSPEHQWSHTTTSGQWCEPSRLTGNLRTNIRTNIRKGEALLVERVSVSSDQIDA